MTTYVSLESQLIFQQPIQRLAILTTISAIDTLVRAHDTRDMCFYGVLEGPKIDFVHSAVVDVGGDGFDDFAARVFAWIALGFLLVADVV